MIEPLKSWDSEATLATFHEDTFRTMFHGLEIQKSAEDLERYTRAIIETRVDLIIETGTRYGGSALWFSENFDVAVVTVDMSPQLTKETRAEFARRGIVSMLGSSTDPMVFELVRGMASRGRVMVTLDSDHHAPHVWDEIRLYSQLVTPGCHLVVEDGCFEQWEGEDERRGGRNIPEFGGPLRAINLAGLAVDPRFVRDWDIESMSPISHSPGGWWQRK